MTRVGAGSLYAHQALETINRKDKPKGNNNSGFPGSISQMLFSISGSCKVEKNKLHVIPLEPFRKERDQCNLHVLGACPARFHVFKDSQFVSCTCLVSKRQD